MVTVEFESHPDARLNIRYFANVSNAAEIGELIRAGDRIPETTALITATLVPDVMLVTAAADKALRAHKAGKLATRTLGSEVGRVQHLRKPAHTRVAAPIRGACGLPARADGVVHWRGVR